MDKYLKKHYLGIDTSNYRTSVAVVDEGGRILYNHRELLKVPEGERGMRQSEAFFHHVQRLPDALVPALEYRDSLKAIAVSTRPRPREGSYMPCFTAGTACAREIACALNVPLHEVSHQEGHIEAVKYYSSLKDTDDIIFFHFSGGTTEAVYRGEIVGGSKDISYGQVLDRIGVRLGYAFPSGEELDRIALNSNDRSNILTSIKVSDGELNLSGIESQAMRAIDNMDDLKLNPEIIVNELMDKLSGSVIRMTDQLVKKCNCKNFIFAGGFSSSEYLRKKLKENLPTDINYVFGPPELSGDNAVGVALLALKAEKGDE